MLCVKGSDCLLSLRKMAQKVKPREKLVFSLIGHGFFKAGVFNFLITTQSDDHISREGEEVSITRDNLKAALKPCRGDTLIISKACYSRHLQGVLLSSPGAILGQAANPPLSYSSSDHFNYLCNHLCNLAALHGGVSWHPHCRCEVFGRFWRCYPLTGWRTPGFCKTLTPYPSQGYGFSGTGSSGIPQGYP